MPNKCIKIIFEFTKAEPYVIVGTEATKTFEILKASGYDPKGEIIREKSSDEDIDKFLARYKRAFNGL